MKHPNRILVISGPTASGKSALALEVSRATPSIIINADSIQLYKALPILSAQPSQQDLKEAEHRLYSILESKESPSVKSWLNLAAEEIRWAFKNKKLPIVVGGTGLYISKLIEGISEIPPISDEVKAYCRNILDGDGKAGLINQMEKLDKEDESLKNLDQQRLLRRLEVLVQTGKAMQEWQAAPVKTFFEKSAFLHISIEPNRETLYQNCDRRFKDMVQGGAIEEVKALLEEYPSPTSSIASTIGLLEIKGVLNSELSLGDATKKAAQKTRNYAKRQLTWFRNQFQDIIRVENPDEINIDNLLDQI